MRFGSPQSSCSTFLSALTRNTWHTHSHTDAWCWLACTCHMNPVVSNVTNLTLRRKRQVFFLFSRLATESSSLPICYVTKRKWEFRKRGSAESLHFLSPTHTYTHMFKLGYWQQYSCLCFWHDSCITLAFVAPWELVRKSVTPNVDVSYGVFPGKKQSCFHLSGSIFWLWRFHEFPQTFMVFHHFQAWRTHFQRPVLFVIA